MDANGSAALAPRRALAAAAGKEKLDILLSAPDPEALVQSIPDHELYLALLEIGPEDAAYVRAQLAEIVKDEDLSRYIL